MPRTVAARELAIVVSRPRALAIKTGLPMALAVILVAGHAPTFWAGMLLTVLMGMIGAVGTAVTVSRAREAGFLTRLAATPGSRPRLLVGWVLAAATVDVIQLLPVAIAVLVTGGGGPAELAVLIVVLAATLVVTNVLGCAVTLAAATASEVLLDVVVLLAPLLYLGGLFTGVPASGWRAVVAAVDPFSHLHSAFIARARGHRDVPGAVDVLAAVAAAVVAIGGLAMVSTRVLERE